MLVDLLLHLLELGFDFLVGSGACSQIVRAEGVASELLWRLEICVSNLDTLLFSVLLFLEADFFFLLFFLLLGPVPLNCFDWVVPETLLQ